MSENPDNLGSSMDVSRDNLPTEPPTPPTRTSEALKANLQSVNTHLDELKRQWEAERKKLVGEKAVLEDAASRLHNHVKDTRDDTRRVAESNRAIERAKINAQTVSQLVRDWVFALTWRLYRNWTKPSEPSPSLKQNSARKGLD